eukprot:scaffold3204_cov185-Alexandrium_tamarense.AAC.10
MLVFRHVREIKDPNGGRTIRHRFDRVASTKANVDFECILTIGGVKANAHPGGAAVLKNYNGLDATSAFERVGHSPYAYKLLTRFAIRRDKDKSANRASELVDASKCKVQVSTWRKKIFTREDPKQIHKCCGLFVLLHFAFRYYQMLFGDVSAGFGSRASRGANFTAILCLLPHFVLSLSSLIFHSVPKERIVGQPMIWKEFRLHSIIFSLRSIVCTFCGWMSVYFHHDPRVRKAMVVVSSASILLANYAADKATEALAPSNSESTTATMPYWEGCRLSTQRRFKSFYAYCQFLATLACLTISNPAWPFAVLLPIQLAAFLMTMCRKGLITGRSYHISYTTSLMLPYIVATRDMNYTRTPDVVVMFVIGSLLYRLRCLGVNKYILWVPMVVLRVFVGDRLISFAVW